jgi:hypothetical protein
MVGPHAAPRLLDPARLVAALALMTVLAVSWRFCPHRSAAAARSCWRTAT